MTLRRTLSLLLMLLMLMPSMACFKSICDAGIMAGMPCCHEKADHKASGIMLIKDCLKNDLGQIAVVKLPVHDGALIMLGLVALMLVLPLPRRGAMLRHIRPPPDPGLDPFAILLATQRFRN